MARFAVEASLLDQFWACMALRARLFFYSAWSSIFDSSRAERSLSYCIKPSVGPNGKAIALLWLIFLIDCVYLELFAAIPFVGHVIPHASPSPLLPTPRVEASRFNISSCLALPWQIFARSVLHLTSTTLSPRPPSPPQTLNKHPSYRYNCFIRYVLISLIDAFRGIRTVAYNGNKCLHLEFGNFYHT